MKEDLHRREELRPKLGANIRYSKINKMRDICLQNVFKPSEHSIRYRNSSMQVNLPGAETQVVLLLLRCPKLKTEKPEDCSCSAAFCRTPVVPPYTMAFDMPTSKLRNCRLTKGNRRSRKRRSRGGKRHCV